ISRRPLPPPIRLPGGFMKASRLALFFACFVSIALINNQDLSAGQDERKLLRSDNGQSTTVTNKSHADLTQAPLPHHALFWNAKQFLTDGYGNLPLSFEPNHGQANPNVKFMSRGSGYTLFLTPTEAVLKLRKGSPRHAWRLPLDRPDQTTVS